MLGEPVLVRELRHVGGGTVDVGEIVILHQDDHELVEVVAGLRMDRSRNRRVSGGDEGNHAPRDDREAATRIEAAIRRNACGRPVVGIKGTSERCPHPDPRYMPTRGRLSILVTAMRNTHVRGTNEKSMLRTFAGSTNPTD